MTVRIYAFWLLSAGLALFWAAPALPTDPPFEGKIAKSAEQSVPAWPKARTAPRDAPNIVVILLDDTGFADTSTFGGIAQTPELDNLARRGLRYNNFNVTAMCSPTRAALLTGRNHHRAGFGIISEGANGYPGYNSYWKESTASVAEVLRQNGYSTAAIGKWHNTPEWEITPVGPFDRWPTGLGFEYFYGFMGAEENHWEPNRLYLGTTPVDAPAKPGETYHLTADMTDKAIGWIRERRSFAPQKPYFLYFATGAAHTPHHAPPEWIARYKGKFDKGWDVLRADIFARQKRLGVIPKDAQLPPRPPQIPAWNSLSKDEQRLFARQMEVYAAFVAHTDYHVGRLLKAIREDAGADDNTLIFYIAGDNGAAGRRLANYGGDATLAEDLSRIDELGGPRVPFNQYQGGWGWMGNTPFKFWKTVASHFGGLRAPMIVSWPRRISEWGGLRQQFQHVTDIVPTIYEAAGLAPPEIVNGAVQQPMDGKSLFATLFDAKAPSTHSTQYFELSGSRAIYHEGWMASALSRFMSPDGNSDNWELYHVAKDFTQARNLAGQNPEKLAELKQLFDREAQANNVYPLMAPAWSPSAKPFVTNGQKRFDFYQGEGSVPWAQLPDFNQAHALEAEIIVPEGGADGVLAVFGYRNKGFAWYIREGKLVFENRAGLDHDILSAEVPLPAGRTTLRYQFDCENCEAGVRSRHTMSGIGKLFVNGKLVAEKRFAKVNFINGGESFSFHLGRAGGSRVSDAFDGNFPFSGKIERLSILVE